VENCAVCTSFHKFFPLVPIIFSVWVIGDDPYSEVSAPQSIGFKAIFVKSGKYKYTPPDIIPDRVYNNFVEVDWENL